MGQWIRQISRVDQVRPLIAEIERALLAGLQAGPAVVTLSRPTRTNEQNRLMWPLLTDCANQIDYHGLKLGKEDWKDLMTVGYEGCQRSAPSLDGQGLVFFGVKTSTYPKDTFSQFIEFIYAEGAQRGVQWSQQSESNIAEVRG